MRGQSNTFTQTHITPTQTLPIRELSKTAPKEEVARFMIKMLYKAEEEGVTYTLNELVKNFLLFGPQSKRSHMASPCELRRALLWLSRQKIIYITNNYMVLTIVDGPLRTDEWILDATNQSVSCFRNSLGKKAKKWFYCTT